jgi:hypothetical protein
MMTTTPPDVLARLQTAWRTGAPPHPRAEAEAELAIVTYCGPHNDPAEWDFTADRYGRPGWQTAHCKRCGKFIGYRSPQQTKRKQKSDANN